jgi:hypothetical protein
LNQVFLILGEIAPEKQVFVGELPPLDKPIDRDRQHERYPKQLTQSELHQRRRAGEFSMC